jgi:hypothetical protein
VDHDPIRDIPPVMRQVGYAFIFLGGILLAMNSRDTEVSTYSETEHVHGYEHDRYCLGAESALHVSLAFFVSARNIHFFITVLNFGLLLLCNCLNHKPN